MFITLMRTLILYCTVILAIRIMGKRQIGDMQPGELVITILISEVAAIPIQDPDIPLVTGIVVVFTLVFLEVFVSVLAMKFNSIRRLVYGTSAIVIKDGKLNQKMLKNLRVTCSDLLEVLRNRDIFDISEVAYAILETNGQLSVLLKTEHQNATRGDINKNSASALLPCLIINDGKIIKDELLNINANKSDITNCLKTHNLETKDVFMMTCDRDLNFTIIKKEKK